MIFSCLFGHDLIRDRNDDGALVLRCQSCNHLQPLFVTEAIRGPQHTAKPIKGQPLIKAKVVKTGRRLPFAVREAK